MVDAKLRLYGVGVKALRLQVRITLRVTNRPFACGAVDLASQGRTKHIVHGSSAVAFGCGLTC